MNTTKSVDILIIGGGLTGATLMLALRNLGFKTLLVESKPFSDKIKPDFDARTLALSPASQRILQMLAIWPQLQDYATPITSIHLSDQHYFGMSRIHGDAQNPLGYVLEMQYISKALRSVLNPEDVLAPASLIALDAANHQATIATDKEELTISATLIVAADGAESTVRKCCQLPVQVKKYQQQAIVTNIIPSKNHNFRAYERFTAHGPLALLPMSDNRMAVVWSLPPETAKQTMALSDAEFLQKLQQAFGYRMGKLLKTGKRFSFHLQQVLMPQQIQWPVVFVGNSAHTLHPVAGQGFNLGLRDVASLAQCIAQYGLQPEMLEIYRQQRSHDQRAITQLTDGLIKLFTSSIPGMGLARSFGLLAFDSMPLLQKLLARYARGFGGVVPDLVCEIALSAEEK